MSIPLSSSSSYAEVLRSPPLRNVPPPSTIKGNRILIVVLKTSKNYIRKKKKSTGMWIIHKHLCRLLQKTLRVCGLSTVTDFCVFWYTHCC